MTDKEIEKALEWCDRFETNIVFNGKGDEKCVQALQMMVVIKHSLKEYNRQKAEIERLQALADAELDTIHKLGDDYESELEKEQEIRAETIKEFGKMLIDKAENGIVCAMDIVDYVFEATQALKGGGK